MSLATKVTAALRQVIKKHGAPLRVSCGDVARQTNVLAPHVAVALRSVKQIEINGTTYSVRRERIGGHTYVVIE